MVVVFGSSFLVCTSTRQVTQKAASSHPAQNPTLEEYFLPFSIVPMGHQVGEDKGTVPGAAGLWWRI